MQWTAHPHLPDAEQDRSGKGGEGNPQMGKGKAFNAWHRRLSHFGQV